MILTSFSELNNQAVPGYQSGMSSYERVVSECEVPSPSQWSDSCQSPPSLHSPMHSKSPSHGSTFDIMKVKEEPYSPQSSMCFITSPQNHNSSTLNHHVPPESSIDLSELLEDNTFTFKAQPSSTTDSDDMLSTPVLPKRDTEEFTFMETVVDIKKENEDYDYMDMTSGITPPVSPEDPIGPQAVGSTPCSTMSQNHFNTFLPIGDVLNTVEKMALEHFRQDLQRVSFTLNIPKDPSVWTLEQTRTWLAFQASHFNLPSGHLVNWRFAGPELIKLTENNFRQLIPEGGELLYAKLEIWREALRTLMERKVGSVDVENSFTGTRFDTDSFGKLSSQPSNLCPSTTSDDTTTFSIPETNYTITIPRITTTYFDSNVHTPLHVFTGSPSVLSNQASPSIQIVSPQPSSMPSPPITPVLQSQKSHLSVSYPSSVASSLSPSPVSPMSPAITLPLPSPSPSPSVSPVRQHDRPQQQEFWKGLEEVSSFMEDSVVTVAASFLTKTEDASPDSAEGRLHEDRRDSDDEAEEAQPSSGARGGTHIHLWQFLKELLQQPQLYGSCIRWLDRSKGIFKIEDSVRVARLWGKRKNRPAMNYDKLSRSIRQYYKKGIMKKTERSQRLVYQFCHPYCL